MNIQDLQIVSSYDRDVYSAYLKTEVCGIDIETDANDYHWLSGERGLSYNADTILISFYAEGLPALVLRAEHRGSEPYEAEFYNPELGEYGVWDYVPIEKKRVKAGVEERYFVNEPLIRNIWGFSEADTNFIKKFFSRNNVTLIAHNLVFDMRLIYGHFNIPVPRQTRFYDTLAMGITTGFFSPDKKKDLYTAVENSLSEEDKAWYGNMKSSRNRLAQIMVEEPDQLDNVLRYAAFDSVAALELYKEQLNTPVYGSDKSDFLLDKYDEVIEVDIQYTRWCVETAARGIKLDVDYAKQKRLEYFSILKEKIVPIGITLQTMWLTGNEKWRRWYFFGLSDEKGQWVTEYPSLNLEIPSDPELLKRHPYLITKGGKPSFGKKAMAYYLQIKDEAFEDDEDEDIEIEEDGELHHADLAALKEFKEAESAWRRCEEFLRHAERDGRIHTIMQSLTNTGRSSSSQMNLMNLKLPLFSGFLIPDDGSSFVELDGSNAEKHVGAMMSADNEYEKVCCQDDYHTAMMSVWGVSDRKTSKTLTFGTDYGMGVQKLSWSLGISYEAAKELIDNKKRMFPATTETQEKISEFAKATGFTLTWTGRRIRIKTVVNQKTNKREYKAYTAYNGTVQGGVGDWTKRSILQLDKYCHENRLQSFVALQVHDSLIVSVKHEEFENVVPTAIEIMATIIPDEWAGRTTPRSRMLCDYHPKSNSKKWGYVHGQDYPRPFTHYLNRWGWHEYTEEELETGKEPTWISGHGWGPEALEAELQGQYVKNVPTPPEISYTHEPYDWRILQNAIQESEAWLRLLPIELNGKIEKFSFVEGIEVLREICHKGLDNQYLTIIESFDKLNETMKQYAKWRERNRNC